MSPKIRRFEPADADAVRSLHILALQGTGGMLPNPGHHDDDLLDIEASYLATGGDFLVVPGNATIIAMGAFRPVDATTAEVKRMRVVPALQGQGLGKAILTELHARARAAGFNRLTLDTTEHQVPAQRLYESFGYRRTHTYTIQGLTVFHYECFLIE